MNRQEAFDAVVRHAHKQGRAARMEHNNRCLYRGPEGTKCFVGALIPDELYDQGMDDGAYRAPELLEAYDEVAALFDFDGAGSFLQRLQNIHDNSGVEAWPHDLMCVANEYQLDTTAWEECYGNGG